MKSFNPGRRHFFRTLGAATTGVVATSMTGTAGPSHNSRRIKVGALLPSSSVYPEMAQNFVDGLNYFFTKEETPAQPPFDLVVEDGGVGQKQAVANAKKLLSSQGVDLLVAQVSAPVAAALKEELASFKCPVLFTGPGVSIPHPNDEDELFFRNCMNSWQAETAMGTWAAQHLGPKALILSSFYDSGYDICYSFQSGFEKAGGSLVQPTVVYDMPPINHDYDKIATLVQQTDPDVIYIASSQPATMILGEIRERRLDVNRHLVVSSYLADERRLHSLAEYAHNLYSCFSWSPQLNNQENKNFVSSFQKHFNYAPDSFTVNGYETAQIIASVIEKTSGRQERLASALKTVSIQSPRGRIKMNTTTRSTNAPLYLRKVERINGQFKNRVLAQLDGPSFKEDFVVAKRSSQPSGWTNAYLSV